MQLPNGLIDQLLERSFSNRKVTGSIPDHCQLLESDGRCSVPPQKVIIQVFFSNVIFAINMKGCFKNN